MKNNYAFPDVQIFEILRTKTSSVPGTIHRHLFFIMLFGFLMLGFRSFGQGQTNFTNENAALNNNSAVMQQAAFQPASPENVNQVPENPAPGNDSPQINQVPGSPGDAPLATVTSTATGGNWNTPGTWVGGSVPLSGDAVVIASAATVTVDGTVTCASLSFTTISANTNLTISGTNSLTVTGLLSMARPAAGFNGYVNVNAGTLTCGSMTLSATAIASSTRLDNIIITTGTATVTGTFTAGATGCVLTISGVGILNFGGTITATPTLTLATASTVNYTSASAQTIISGTYGNLSITGAGTKTLVAAAQVRVNGNFSNSSTVVMTAGTSSTAYTYLIIGGTGTYINNTGGVITAIANYTSFYFLGTSAQTFTNSGSFTSPVYSVSVDNNAGVSLSGNSIITTRVNLFDGVLTNSNLLTIGAGAATSASIQRGVAPNTYPAGSFDVAPTFNVGSGGLSLFYDNGSVAYSTGNEVPATLTAANLYVFDAADLTLSTNITLSTLLNIYGGTGTPILRIGAHTLTLGGTITYTVTGAIYGGVTSNLIMNGATSVNTITNGLNNFTVNGNTTFLGSNTVYGTTTINTGITLNLGAFTLALAGPVANSGTITANAAGGTLSFQGSSSQTLGGTLTSSQIANLTINNTAGVTITPSAQVNTALTLTAGALACSGTLTLGNGAATAIAVTTTNGSITGTPTFNLGTGANTFTYNGVSPQTTGTELPATMAAGTLVITNAAGVTLNAAKSVQKLTLTSGALTTTAANLLTVTSTTSGDVARTSGYVNGPLVRRLPLSLSTGTTYLWPVGKTIYTPFELINATTTAGGTVDVMAEVFEGNCGGTAGSGMAALNTDRYWSSSISAGAANFTNTTVRVTDAASIPATKALGGSATQTGTYTQVGYALSGATLQSNTITSPGYYVIGDKGTIAGGTYDVGTSQPLLKKLTDVANQLNGNVLTGNVIYELNADYDGTTGETFPITFYQFGTSGGTWTATVRVKSGAAGRTTSGNNATNLIRFDGVDNLTFDGRENGVGSANAWTFSNTNTAGTTFTFINDASTNTLKYCNIQSVNASTSSGTVVFSTTSASTGNDNNVVTYCDIYDGTSLPYNAIYALGTTTTTATYNSTCTISNCTIRNFFNPGGASYGLYLGVGNTDWIISDNSFYQTATCTATSAATPYGIYISNAGNNFTVTGNYIGGGAANCAGTAWTVAGAFTNKFVGMYLSPGTVTATSVQGNTLNNLDFTTTSGTTTGAGSFCGINIAGGAVNVGNVIGNVIGSSTIDKVKLTSSAAALLVGINSSSTSPVNISNNTIYGLTSIGNAAAVGAYLTGIQTSGTAGNYTINANTIGSTTVANSMRAGVSGTTTAATYTIGINNSATGTISISQNTLGNLVSYGVNTSSTIRGIVSSAGTNTVTQNVVRDHSTPCSNVGTTSAASVIGILFTSATAGTNLSQNTVFNLSSSHATAAVCLTGIHYAGATTGTNVVDRNLVYGLSIVSSSASCDLRGIHFASGLANVQNNMIRLGYDGSGAALTSGIQITGLYDAVSSAGTGMYFNSVYIGGTGVNTVAGGTYAFRSDQTTNVRTYEDNIFYNARSNATTGGKHYAVRVAGTGVNPTGLVLNYNDYLTIGTGAVFGYYNADVASLSAWKTAVGQDASSLNNDPQYAGATATTPDLHLTVGTPCEGTGLAIGSIMDDFDGQTRSSLTPTDIGADAGDYGLLGIDMGPTALVAPLTSGCHTSAEAVTVTIKNYSATPIDFSVNPVTITVTETTGGTGYNNNKIVSTATLASGATANYTLDAAISMTVNGAYTFIVSTVVTGDLNPANNNLAPVVSTVAQLGGVYTVGAGGNYTTLTNAITAYNNAICLTGAVTFSLTDATYSGSETFPITINANASANASNTLTIKPASGVSTILTGTTASAALALNGCSYVILDGSNQPGGTTKDFTISNTYAGGTFNFAVGLYHNGAQGANNCNIKNCIIIGTPTVTSSYGLFLNAGGGNFHNTSIVNNTIKNARIGIQFVGVAGAITNNGLISGNTIGDATQPLLQGGISCGYVDNLTITGNDIFGQSVGNANYYQYGITLGTGSTNSKIRNNKIHDFYYNGTAGYGCFGILFSSDATTVTEITNNAIYAIKGDGDVVSGGSTNFLYIPSGISISSGGNVKIYYNSINLTGAVLGTSYTGNSSCIMVNSSITLLDIRDNILKNSMTTASGSGTNKTYGLVSFSSNTAFTSINYNNYYVNGINPNVGYLTSDRATISAWQTASGQDVNSISADPLYTSNTNLLPQAGSLVISAGIPIGSVTTDITGATRSLTTPTMGAYEIVSGSLTWTGATDNDWNKSTNWSPDGVPNTSTAVTIPPVTNNPIVYQLPANPAQCGNMTLNTGAVLTINPGKALTVNGTLTSTAGTTGLVVKSDATGTGSLILNTALVDGTVERWMTDADWTNWIDGWHFLSSPVGSQAVSAFTTDPITDYDFYCWQESTNTWVNYKNESVAPTWTTANGSPNFTVGRGYLVAYNNAQTKTFSGALNVADVVNTSLTYTPASYSGDVTAGFNLLGNPFSCALKWSTGWSKTNIAANAKIWNELGAAYVDIAANGIIPATQGFMVEVTSGTGSVTIPAAARTHDATPWYKSTGNPYIKLVARNLDAQTAQESIVTFDEQAPAGYSPDFDSHFLPGYAPSFYSVDGTEHLSTNVLPSLDNQTTVPFNFIKTTGTSFSIEAVKIDNVPAQVYLTDLKINKTQNLAENPVYDFTASDGDDPARFLLSFSHVGISEKSWSNNGIYAYENNLYVVNPGKARLEVYNLTGQKLLAERIDSPGLYKTTLNVPTGYYVVRLTTGSKVVVTKVFIKS